MNKKILISLIILVLLSAGAYFFVSRQEPASPAPGAEKMPVAASGGNAQPESPAIKDLNNEHGVLISNFSFAPKELRIRAGTKVVWTNDDSAGHTVTSDNGKFGSQLLAQGNKFEFIFSEKGTFAYHCSLHPNMKATVTVE